MPDTDQSGTRRAALVAGLVHLFLWGVVYFMAMDMWGSPPVRDTFGGRADVFSLAIAFWIGSGIAAVVLFLAGLRRARRN